MKTITQKKQPKQHVDQNPIEAIRSIGSGFKKSMKDDLMEQSVHDAWNQLSKSESLQNANEGKLSAGQELQLASIEQTTIKITEQGRAYSKEITNAGTNNSRRETQGIEVRLQEILIEIKTLSKSSKQLEKKVQVTTLEQGVVNPGVYHEKWFEKILLDLRDVRASVEDGLAWFSALRSKKASKQYGKMAKKHGTGFTLSNERTAATQTG